MKSVRLNNEDRDRIVKIMLIPLAKKQEEYEKSIGSILQEVIERETPAEVWEIAEKYPDLILISHTVSNLTFPDISLLEYTSFPVIRYIRYFPPSWGVEGIFGDRVDEIKEKLEALKHCQKERRAMKNKLSCILSRINTSKQLQEQFPEAYEAFKSLLGEVEHHLCDSVEKLRAEFNKVIKS